MSKENLLSGKMLIAQTQYHISEKQRIEIARKIIDGSSFNLLKNLKYYESRGKDLFPIIEAIEKYRAKLDNCKKIDELMGIEGNIRNVYYTYPLSEKKRSPLLLS